MLRQQKASPLSQRRCFFNDVRLYYTAEKYCGIKPLILSKVSVTDNSLIPPEAFACPPPLKCSLAITFTGFSAPFDRKDIYIMPSLSVNTIAAFMPLIDKTWLAKLSVSPFW